jgi:hypothetical protein
MNAGRQPSGNRRWPDRGDRNAFAVEHRLPAIFEVGNSQGYGTLGLIGFENRSRVYDRRHSREPCTQDSMMAAVRSEVAPEDVSDLSLKGLRRSIRAYNVIELKK